MLDSMLQNHIQSENSPSPIATRTTLTKQEVANTHTSKTPSFHLQYFNALGENEPNTNTTHENIKPSLSFTANFDITNGAKSFTPPPAPPKVGFLTTSTWAV